jgi:hypothetical protein
MNRINVAIAIIAAAVLLVVGNAQTANQGQVGRYQLVAGEHAIAGQQTTITQKAILKIDTTTGETSVWAVVEDKDGTLRSSWSPTGK